MLTTFGVQTPPRFGCARRCARARYLRVARLCAVVWFVRDFSRARALAQLTHKRCRAGSGLDLVRDRPASQQRRAVMMLKLKYGIRIVLVGV